MLRKISNEIHKSIRIEIMGMEVIVFCSHIMGKHEKGGGDMVRENCIPTFSRIHVIINLDTIFYYNQNILIIAAMHYKGKNE